VITLGHGDIVNIDGQPVQLMSTPEDMGGGVWAITYRTKAGGSIYHGRADIQDINEMKETKR
jgi:hypothetical protein